MYAGILGEMAGAHKSLAEFFVFLFSIFICDSSDADVGVDVDAN